MSEDFFETFRKIRREIEKIVEDMEKSFEKDFLEISKGITEPLSYIYETPDEIIVSLDLPLVKRKEDINIKVKDHEMEINAEIAKAPSFNVVNPFYKRYKCDFYRKIIRLPEDADINNTKAKFVNGILEIRVPKKHKGFKVKVE